jgi:hypothetical protein
VSSDRWSMCSSHQLELFMGPSWGSSTSRQDQTVAKGSGPRRRTHLEVSGVMAGVSQTPHGG